MILKNLVKHCLKNNVKINSKQLYSMIDTFSLGILISYLFIDFNLISKIKSSVFLTDLFNLFSRTKNLIIINELNQMNV